MIIFSRRLTLIACASLSVLMQLCDSRDTSKSTQTQIDSTNTVGANLLSIQIAAMRDKRNAEKLNSALEKTELSAYIFRDTTTLGDSLFKVRVGPFTSETDAQESLENLKDLGYSEAFILQRPEPEEELDSALDDAPVKKQLTFEGDCSAPSWSPSNREIAFYKGANNRGGIYGIGTGGGQISKIVKSAESRRITKTFAWSPSGKRLAFTAIEMNKDWQPVENLFLIDKNGSNQEKIVNQVRLPYDISSALMWSPDGDRIAFNANYGKSDSWSDLFQMVKIVSFGGEKRPIVNELASTERINSVLGWKSNNELLFVADYDDVDRLGYEVWSYEIRTKRRKVIARGPVMPEFTEILFIASEDLVIYTSFTSDKMMSLDLATGRERILFESQLDNPGGVSSLNLSNANEIFFLSDKSLLKRNKSGQIAMADIEVPSRYFSLSPRGRKLCFAENGDVFTIKLPFKNSSMNTK